MSAWENLTRNLLHEAGGEGFITSAGLTSKGRQLFAEAATSWSRYLALEGKKPNLELAKDMLRIYRRRRPEPALPGGHAAAVVVAAEPTNASYYADLAEVAYKAHDTSIGDLASAKAVALAPESSARTPQARAEEFKKAVAKEKSSTSSTPRPPA